MNPPLTETLQAIRRECEEVIALAEKATPGPWTKETAKQAQGKPKGKRRIASPPDESGHKHTVANTARWNSRANAALIATSRTLAPKLARATLTAIKGLSIISSYEGVESQHAIIALETLATSWLQ